MTRKIELGQTIHHVVTGIEGLVVSRTEYLSGCAQIGVQRPLDKDGEVPKIRWCDEPMCKVICKAKLKPPEDPDDNGGPQDNPPDRS